MLGNMRSKTMPPQQSLNRPKLGGRRSSYMTGDRLRVAKDMVDKAIRVGGYLQQLLLCSVLLSNTVSP